MAASESPSSEGHLTCLENVSDSATLKFRFFVQLSPVQ